jgi:hypothetical protein
MTYCRPEKYNVLIDASIVTETRGRDSSKKANHKPQYRKEGKHESRQWDGKKGKGGRGGILCIVGGGLGRASRAFLGHSRVEGGERGRDVRGNCWRNDGGNKTRQTGGRKKETVWAGNEIASELSPGKSIFLHSCGRQKGSCGGSGVNGPPVPCLHIQSRRPIGGVTDGGGGRRRGRACPGHWVRKRGTFLGCEAR